MAATATAGHASHGRCRSLLANGIPGGAIVRHRGGSVYLDFHHPNSHVSVELSSPKELVTSLTAPYSLFHFFPRLPSHFLPRLDLQILSQSSMAIFSHNRREGEGLDAVPARPATGWPAVFKALRDADITKVDDCRDDIDTLLVFAGLYSAVLTAFVIESYTHLQQDSQDIIIGLLQQIAAQNFTSGPGFLNSTNPSPSSPSFEPPLWAIRVNVLWFTSLLLSLASASFGILVKQWLREYLALEYAAPRERLRARQYRNPAMSDWKVFEIAAFLPLLLQASLGLFFVGLCFFTAAVHDSVGRTTAPLVCAWAFLVLMTTIAPLFSPRCPYKTTFLKRALRVGRRYVSPPARHLARSIRLLPYVFRAQASVAWASMVLWVHRTYSRVPRTVFRPTPSSHMHWSGTNWETDTEPQPGPELTENLASFAHWDNAFTRIEERNTREDLLVRKEQESCQEEDQVVKTEAEDLEILTSIDSIMSDDGLLPTMLDALRQLSGANHANFIQFISQIIGRRIDQDLGIPRLTFVPDLRTLSKFVWLTVTDAIADTLLQHNSGPLILDTSSRDWVFNSIAILCYSPSHFDLSEHATNTLRAVTVSPSRTSDHNCIGGVRLSQCLPRDKFKLPAAPLDSVDPEARTCLRCIADFYRILLCNSTDPEHSHQSLFHLLDTHVLGSSFMASSGGFLTDMIAVLASESSLLWTVSSQQVQQEVNGCDEATRIILHYGDKFGRSDDVVELGLHLLSTDFGTRVILGQSSELHFRARIDGPGILWRTYLSTSLQGQDRIRTHLISVCKQFCDDDGSTNSIPLDYVRLYAACFRLIDGSIHEILAHAIKRYYQTQGWRGVLRTGDYRYGEARGASALEDIFREDQAIVCGIIQDCPSFFWSPPITVLDALWPFVPEARRAEILRSIHKHWPYRPPPTHTTTAGTEDLCLEAMQDFAYWG